MIGRESTPGARQCASREKERRAFLDGAEQEMIRLRGYPLTTEERAQAEAEALRLYPEPAVSADPYDVAGGFFAPGPASEEELACPACGHCWYTDGYADTGRWWPVNEDDALCPVCGVEGEL